MNVLDILLQEALPDMLRADYWLSSDEPLLDTAEIAQFNSGVYRQLGIPGIFDLPEHLSATEVQAFIQQYTIPTKPRYDGWGEVLNDPAQLQQNALHDLPSTVNVRFGLVTHRSHLRAFPTFDIYSPDPHAIHQDMLQETAIDIGVAVAILASSRDAHWLFCLTPLYWGWLPRAHVATLSRENTRQFVTATDRIVTLSPRGLIGLRSGGGVTPQMGTSLPLLEETESVYRVQVPINHNGEVDLVEGVALKSRSPISHFRRGFQDASPNNLFRTAFSLLGDRYAWGGSRVGIFGRDCSRLVQDVYATVGVHLPRNGDEQEQATNARITFTPETVDRKRLIVSMAKPGDLLFTPGHVMLYLGAVEGEPYVIHAKGGAHQCVLVSTLDIGDQGPLLDRLTSLTCVGGAT